MVADHSKTTDLLKSLVSDNDIKAQLPLLWSIGEKDVGVPFDNLDFRATGVAADLSSGTGDGKDERAEEKRERAKDAREARYDSEHENIDIVLNATREQLEKAPSFVWLDQQDSTGKRSERSTE